MDEELNAIIRAYQFKECDGAFVLKRGDTEWIAVRFGMRKKGVEQRLKVAINKHEPERLIVVGFAGGLDESLNVGDTLAIDYAQLENGKTISLVNDDGVPTVVNRLKVPSMQAPIVTEFLAAAHPDVKRVLAARSECRLVDMETFHVATLCAELKLPLKVWRAISDGAHDCIPARALSWVREDGSNRLVRAAFDICLRPTLWRAVSRMRRNARLAAAGLVEALRDEFE